MNDKPAPEVDVRMERIRYDGFRAFLLGRDPTQRLADAFAQQVVARGEQGKYDGDEESHAVIAQDFYYWVV